MPYWNFRRNDEAPTPIRPFPFDAGWIPEIAESKEPLITLSWVVESYDALGDAWDYEEEYDDAFFTPHLTPILNPTRDWKALLSGLTVHRWGWGGFVETEGSEEVSCSMTAQSEEQSALFLEFVKDIAREHPYWGLSVQSWTFTRVKPKKMNTFDAHLDWEYTRAATYEE